MPATATAPWTIAGSVALARVSGVEARLDLARPGAGLVIAGPDGEDRLLGLDLRGPVGPPADHWARGGDLVAIYEPADPRRLRATAMWRVHPAAVPAWELVVSAQTALLHADAALGVVSDCGAAGASWAAPDGRWTALRGGPLPAEAAFVLARRGSSGLLVGVHPQDPRRITASVAGGRARVACDIFPTAIEKGVILRSRVLAAVGPAANADGWAREVCAAFAASPPFLDT